MDRLLTAVADVALLVATARALRAPATPTAAADLRGRRRLRDELRRAAASYLKTLLRSEGATGHPDALAACRVAAEDRMPRAIAAGDALRELMTHEGGALEGFASGRHDLWRLARLAISVRESTVDREGLDREARALRKSNRQLGKRLRKALVAYVRAAVRSDGTTTAAIAEARRAALDELGLDRAPANGTAGAPPEPAGHAFGTGLPRGLRDVIADWHPAGGPSAELAGRVHLSRPTISLELTFGRIFRRLARRT